MCCAQFFHAMIFPHGNISHSSLAMKFWMSCLLSDVSIAFFDKIYLYENLFRKTEIKIDTKYTKHRQAKCIDLLVPLCVRWVSCRMSSVHIIVNIDHISAYALNAVHNSSGHDLYIKIVEFEISFPKNMNGDAYPYPLHLELMINLE